ncbi:MAG: TonB family protein [Fibrobacteria bacterium]
MGDKTNRGDLEWDALPTPVPINRIEAGFEPQAATSDPSGSPSETVLSADPEALVNAADAPPFPEATVQMSGHGLPAESQATDNPPTLQMPAQSSSFYVTGGTGGGSRAKAEAEAEKKAEVEKEEAGQRQRLEQWMENARKRVLAADEDLTPPSAHIRSRKELSPSLHRLLELQKTIWVDGPSLNTDPANAGAGPVKFPASLDPMATISVTREEFLSLGPPAQPTMREQALDRQAQQQAAQLAAIQRSGKQPGKQASAAPKEETQNALTMHTAPAGARRAGSPGTPGSQKNGETVFQTMTREQALSRKVAHLRMVAEGAENTLAIGPVEQQSERPGVPYKIAVVVIATICLLGIALFAATQAGLFDGLENRLPFLRPKVSAAPRPVPGPPVRASSAARRPAPSATHPALETAPGNQPHPLGNPAATHAETSAGTRKPSLPKPRAKAANGAEAILRASIRAATNIETENLVEMYNRYALGFPGLSGEVLIRLIVDPSGRILEGSVVNSSTGVEAFDQELLRKILDWRLRAFPESHPKAITVPFLFPLQGR